MTGGIPSGSQSNAGVPDWGAGFSLSVDRGPIVSKEEGPSEGLPLLVPGIQASLCLVRNVAWPSAAEPLSLKGLRSHPPVQATLAYRQTWGRYRYLTELAGRQCHRESDLLHS